MCSVSVFRFTSMLECRLITLKAFSSPYTVSSYRLAKLSDGFFRAKSLIERKQTELLEYMSKQNTVLDGEFCLILKVGLSFSVFNLIQT